MFRVVSNILGVPQIGVQQTQADWKKFLGYEGSATIPLMRPGTIVEAWDGIFGVSKFMLAYGVASLAIGDAVVIQHSHATTRTVAASRGIVGISMFANTDTAALSWFCVQGLVPAKAATFAVNLPAYLTATAGSLSSTVVSTQGVTGAVSTLAASGTVTTKTVQTVSGSGIIQVPDLDGLYVGQSVTGTGVGASAVISEIGSGGQMLGVAQGAMGQSYIRVSVVSTASGSVTGTFAHPATFCTLALAHPIAAGLG